jgi:hypothetical protein
MSMIEITGDYSIPITLFFTGKCAKEKPDQIKKISSKSNVEIGGHNYFAFKPRFPFEVYHHLRGLKNGPYIFQWCEVGITKKVFWKNCNIDILSWRDHAYRHDKNTRKILQSHNIKYFSDLLSKSGGQPKRKHGVIDVPINTLPDHDYVFHGARQPNNIDPQILLRTHFSTAPMQKEVWLKRIMKEVKEITSKRGVATILTHPACMEVFDGFKTFKKLCNFLKDYKLCLMRDLENLLDI